MRTRAVLTQRVIDLATTLRDATVRTLFQPIVDLDTGRTAAFEALARGPSGSSIESADALFDTARQAGRVAELDRLCRRVALERARVVLTAETLLFVNVEPDVLASDHRILARAPSTFGRPVVFEVTERALVDDPAYLLIAVAAARDSGCRIALDDVGADPHSLALLPLVHPEVVKLDMRLLHDEPDAILGSTMSAVMAYAERTGATILAEGIETPEHRARAVTLGASLGQGWLFGKATATPDATDIADARLPAPHRTRSVDPSPFDTVAAASIAARTGTKRVLLQFSRQLEAQALTDPSRPIVLAAFQRAEIFTPATRTRYKDLASHCSFVAAFGADLSDNPAPGVRGAHLPEGDPLRDEWSLVVLGPHFAGALLARDLGDTGNDLDRRFAFFVTHDRTHVEVAAESLMRRVTALRT